MLSREQQRELLALALLAVAFFLLLALIPVLTSTGKGSDINDAPSNGSSCCGLFCITHLEASKLGIKGLAPRDLPRFFLTLKEGLHYLLPLAVLLYELIILRHSPEMAAFRSIMVLFVVIIFQEIRRAHRAGWGILTGIRHSIIVIGTGMIQGS